MNTYLTLKFHEMNINNMAFKHKHEHSNLRYNTTSCVVSASPRVVSVESTRRNFIKAYINVYLHLIRYSIFYRKEQNYCS